MTFSVVIPTYNAAETIGKAIDSCLRQSNRPIEIIVVLDGGTDQTEAIIRRDFPEVSLIVSQENKGTSYARNLGIKAAKADWVAFLDADDEWHPDKLKILDCYIRQQPKATCFIHAFSTNDLKIYEDLPNSSAHKVKFMKQLFKNKAQGSCISVKRKANVFFNQSFRYCEDHELALRQSYFGQCYFLPYSLTKLGRTPLSKGGLSGNHWAMRRGEIKMYAQLWRLHILLIIVSPLLIVFSLLKHSWKAL